MNWRKIFLILIVLGIVVAAWYGYREYTRKNADLKKVKPDYSLTAINLIGEYEKGDSAAARKYNGSIIEVHGYVKKIDRDDLGFYTVIMGDTANLSAVRCSMDTSHNSDAALLKEGSSATLRGACTGFNKDEMGLGSDVILNRCVIINK